MNSIILLSLVLKMFDIKRKVFFLFKANIKMIGPITLVYIIAINQNRLDLSYYMY